LIEVVLKLPSNRRLQLTAFGARDRGFFDVILCRAPRRQLKRNTLGGSQSTIVPEEGP